jgi:hypothetical protein
MKRGHEECDELAGAIQIVLQNAKKLSPEDQDELRRALGLWRQRQATDAKYDEILECIDEDIEGLKQLALRALERSSARYETLGSEVSNLSKMRDAIIRGELKEAYKIAKESRFEFTGVESYEDLFLETGDVEDDGESAGDPVSDEAED